ncbi:MAG: HD-GYP domain-containing protein [Planctomycetota bacterium]|jgi:HD-GYP domain-containing protein (c-di-GMP phosphodiesterase class II)
MFDEKYFSIPTSTIRSGLILDFELYKREGKDFGPAFSDRLPLITPENLNELQANGIDILHVSTSESEQFRAYLERNLARIVGDENLGKREKARVLYYTAKVYVREWFNNPQIGPTLEASVELIHDIIKQVLKSEKAFYDFFNLNGESPYLLSHSLNVAIYGIAIMNAMGNARIDEVETYAYGALMHDLGMRDVPDEIITKPDKLTPEEFKLVRKHPSAGAKIAASDANLPTPGDIIVAQHHERLDGQGYPWGISADDIHPLARICSIADVFDAMTSKRSYKDAVNTYDAFKTMKFQESSKFDMAILDTFIRLMTA